jgi:cyanophycin synthetase
MEFRKILTLRGPNVWANFPVLEAWVDLGPYNDSCSSDIPGFNERIKGWLPSLVQHRCSVGEVGGFFQRLDRGTYPAHILEHLTIELQALCGSDVGFGRARLIDDNELGIYRVIVEFEQEELAHACLHAGREILLAALNGKDYDVPARLAELRALAHEVRLGPSTRSIVQAAQRRGIPHRRINGANLVQLGYGSRQRKIWTAETDHTSSIAESIAKDKQLTRQMLQCIGVPTPDGRVVTSAEDAWEAAEEIGVPVVVKPQDGNFGRGVATNLITREQVIKAYELARPEGDGVVVEKYAEGSDFRLLVVGDKLVAAARREPAHVIGDGVQTIRQLVEIENKNPLRSDGHATSLSYLPLDGLSLEVLASQGFTSECTPAAGQRVLIRRNANLSSGGTATDVTDFVHPEIAARAIDAAKAVGLDICGIDVVVRDIAQPLESQGGVVVEVNAGPGLRMHLNPTSGKPRPVGEAIVDMMFGEGRTGRIPIVAVTGVNGKTTTTRLCAHIFRALGRRVGMTNTEGVYFDGRRIESGDCSGPGSAQKVLANPLVDVAVLETARGGVLRAGLGFDRCDVAVVTNISDGDHLGLGGVNDLETLAKVKRVIVDVVTPHGFAVLNAADPLVAAMAPHCPGGVIYFAYSPDNEIIQKHRAAGGKAVFVKRDFVVLAEGDVEIPLVALAHVPLTHGGRIRFQVENVLAAAAAATALSVPRDAIRTGLETFSPHLDGSPGRFNLLEVNGATVVVDYGHNTSALAALIDAFGNFPQKRRRALFSVAGDRRDSDLVEMGRLLGEHFDGVILYEDQYVRGRAEGEISRLIRQGVEQGSRTREVAEIRGSIAAVERVLATVEPGELLLLQADEIDTTVNYLKQYLAAHPDVRQVELAVDVPSPAVEVVETAGAAEVQMLAESPPALKRQPVLAVQDCGG